MSQSTPIQLADLVRVLNVKKELLFWTSHELAERHIEVGEAHWETLKRRKKKKKLRGAEAVLIWIGKHMVPAERIVVKLGPDHSLFYASSRGGRKITWEIIREHRQVAYITVLIEVGAVPVVKHRHTMPVEQPIEIPRVDLPFPVPHTEAMAA